MLAARDGRRIIGLFLLAFLLAGAHLIHRTFFYKSAPLIVFEKFIRAHRNGDCAQMADTTAGNARAYINWLCAPEATGRAIREQARLSVSVSLESQVIDGNRATLIVRDEVDVPRTRYSEPPAPLRRTGRLLRTTQGWKLVAFSEEPLR